MAKKKSKQTGIKVFLITLLVATVVFIAVCWGYFQFKAQLSPVVKTEDFQLVLVKNGLNYEQLAEFLAQKKLIRSAWAFRMIVKLEPKKPIVYGYYYLSPHLRMREILRKIQDGEVAIAILTIPEGYTLKDISLLLGEKKITDPKKFLQLAMKGSVSFNGKTVVKNGSLEGYLFPDTYNFKLFIEPQEVIKAMLNRFKDTLPPDSDLLAQKQGITLREAVILASLIEKEAKIDKDRPLISAVYYNRLRKGMLFQCDATIQYILPERKPILTYQDLKTKSPYNTYIYKGFPPTAIANAGLPSIKAALNPAKADYLYYVARKDGSHYFSQTYEEHLQAIKKIYGKD